MNESLLPVDVAGVHDHRSNENRPTLKPESSGARRAMDMDDSGAAWTRPRSSISTDGVVGVAKGVVPSCYHYVRQALSRLDFQIGLPDGVRPSGAVSGAVVCGDLG